MNSQAIFLFELQVITNFLHGFWAYAPYLLQVIRFCKSGAVRFLFGKIFTISNYRGGLAYAYTWQSRQAGNRCLIGINSAFKLNFAGMLCCEGLRNAKA